MTILVTAASGHLGRLTIDALLARGVSASEIVAGARTPSKVADLADHGVRTVELDYSVPASIASALDGIDTVLLISGSEPGKRAEGHKNVIDAARTANVAKLVYTSAPKATTVDWVLAPDHRATEEALAASGVPFVVLRNNWYVENFTGLVLGAAESGVITASVGDGRVASATRQDFAEAAAVVLTEDGHLGKVYELGGDIAWDYDELAAAASDVLHRAVSYVPVTAADHLSALEAAGTDAGTAGFLVAVDGAIAQGVLADTDGTLSRLIGRPTTPLRDGLRADIALKQS